ncbi:hypothetical protein Bca4012_064002 [Brassica carinata]
MSGSGMDIRSKARVNWYSVFIQNQLNWEGFLLRRCEQIPLGCRVVSRLALVSCVLFIPAAVNTILSTNLCPHNLKVATVMATKLFSPSLCLVHG